MSFVLSGLRDRAIEATEEQVFVLVIMLFAGVVAGEESFGAESARNCICFPAVPLLI